MKSEKPVVGFIGLGVMGKSMAGHILSQGYALHVHTRTQKTARGLVGKGAIWEDGVAALSSRCDVVITIVGFPKDVEEVYFGEAGIISNAKKDAVVIDMTTSSPELAEKIYESGRQKGVHALDAPVSVGDIVSNNASLSIMVVSDIDVFELPVPLFAVMGINVVYQGKAGSGQHTKMVNQIAIAAGMVAVREAISYAKNAGLDPETVLKSISQGAAGSWTLNNLGPRMIKADYEPGFYVKHFIKDMAIAKASSKDMGLDTPGLDLTLSLYRKMSEMGMDENGTQALFKLFNA